MLRKWNSSRCTGQKLDAKLEIVSEKKAELEEEAAELDGILNVIDKIIDSTEVEY